MASIEEQRKLEHSMYTEAERRQEKAYEAVLKQAPAVSTPLGRSIYHSLQRKYAKALSDMLTDANNRSGRAHRSAAPIAQIQETGLHPSLLSDIVLKATIQTILQQIALRRPVTKNSVCVAIANDVHTEWRLQSLLSLEPALVKKLNTKFAERNYSNQMRIDSFRRYSERLDGEWNRWTRREKTAIGLVFLTYLMRCTDLITFDDSAHMQLHPDLHTVFTRINADTLDQFILYKPCLLDPLPWSAESNLFHGAYYAKEYALSYPIIKGARNRDKQRIRSIDWSQTLPAVNAIQRTRWRINHTIVDTVDWCLNSFRKPVGKLPVGDRPEMPAKPYNYDTDEQVRKDHNVVYFRAKVADKVWMSHFVSAKMTLALAQRFRNTSFAFPHNLDSRGRMYPLTAFLNPQGVEYAKAMLDFDEAKLITKANRGGHWLAVATANTYGYDKASLTEREQWVHDNEAMIVSCASSPREDIRWMQADEPFSFLRCCLEWKAYKEAGYDNYLSHMPVHVDATNSGLQHYSALQRSERGGKSVNLVPGLPRQDIYGEVAEEAIRLLKEEGSAEALNLIAFGVDRSITKRSTMVSVYAATFNACMRYVDDAVIEKASTGVHAAWSMTDGEEHRKHVVLLSKCVWQAIDNVVVEGKLAMNWLKDFGRAYAHAVNKQDEKKTAYDKAMTFTTYDGFEVLQHRPSSKLERVSVQIDGSRITISRFVEDGEPRAGTQQDARSFATSIAPNFIHAQDACHLRLAVNKAIELDITQSFSMVHDSFGVHAACMDAFSKECIRPTFVQMYSESDPLVALFEKYKDLLPADFPPPPEKGNLDLQGVLDSEFFFS